MFWGLIIAAMVFGKQGDIWIRAVPDGIWEAAVNFAIYMCKSKESTRTTSVNDNKFSEADHPIQSRCSWLIDGAPQYKQQQN